MKRKEEEERIYGQKEREGRGEIEAIIQSPSSVSSIYIYALLRRG